MDGWRSPARAATPRRAESASSLIRDNLHDEGQERLLGHHRELPSSGHHRRIPA
jgi:hypothetical protein